MNAAGLVGIVFNDFFYNGENLEFIVKGLLGLCGLFKAVLRLLGYPCYIVRYLSNSALLLLGCAADAS